jgi:hypothetical protein
MDSCTKYFHIDTYDIFVPTTERDRKCMRERDFHLQFLFLNKIQY